MLGYILKDCRQEKAEPIHNIIGCSLKTGIIIKEWKRANIMPISEMETKNHLIIHQCHWPA